MAALNVFRNVGQDEFKLRIRMEKKGDLSDFERGMVVGAR